MQAVPDDLFSPAEPKTELDISSLDKEVQNMYERLSEDAKDLLRSLMFLTGYKKEE